MDLAFRLAFLANRDIDWRHRMRFMATGHAWRDDQRSLPDLDELRGEENVLSEEGNDEDND